MPVKKDSVGRDHSRGKWVARVVISKGLRDRLYRLQLKLGKRKLVEAIEVCVGAYEKAMKRRDAEATRAAETVDAARMRERIQEFEDRS